MYEQNSFEPVARVVQLSEVLEKQRINNAVTHVWQYVPSGIVNQDVLDNVEKAKQPLVKIYHYHCNHLGTPQELTNQDGDVIWLSYDRAWGGSFETIYKPQFIDNWAISESELQPIKFQGQSLDTETGLHYNRFRYYDSDVGMFISRDPIGLMGGSNVFQYAPNPVMWIDPWGLAKVNRNSNSAKGKYELYAIYENKSSNAKILKIGKAKSEDVMADGITNRRANTSARIARKRGFPDAIQKPYKILGETTTGKAKKVEAKEVRKLRNKGHELPLNREKTKAYQANSKKRGTPCL